MHSGRYVVMGVCGSGKSLLGSALAQELDVEFVEGDAFHSRANVAKMSAGIPLTDDDRAGWLRAIGERLALARRDGVGLVISCSALKRSYRDLLRATAGDLRFIYLRGTAELLAQRLAARTGHFMPPSMLASQLATLEEPAPDERAWVCDAAQPADVLVAALARRARA
jgi:gluconokinase